MDSWKNWLFPVLTLLTVAVLALLPLRLSTLEDGKLTGAVHTEALPEDSNFPAAPPELPGRLWLLVQFHEKPDTLTIMGQELEGGELDRENQRLEAALEALADLLPPETAGLVKQTGGASWKRYYLRDQTDLASASFAFADGYDKDTIAHFTAQLDGVSGQLVALHLHTPERFTHRQSARELGEALLGRLGLVYEVTETSGFEDSVSFASFRLTEWKGLFLIAQSEDTLDFNFLLDWSAMDASLAEAYGRADSDWSGQMKYDAD